MENVINTGWGTGFKFINDLPVLLSYQAKALTGKILITYQVISE
jgi:hypothetical protein